VDCSRGCAVPEAAGELGARIAAGEHVSTPPLFLVDQLPAGEHAELTGPEGRHAATVRRIQVGELLLLGDGRGTRAIGEVVAVRRDALDIRITKREWTPRSIPTVTLAQALVKGERGELAVELATEAGVDEVLPWRAVRCVVRWDEGARGVKALARWRATAVAASKQSRRAWLPEIGAPVNTQDLVARCSRLREPTGAALLLHEAATTPIAQVVAELREVAQLLVVVGPEGGLSDGELAALTAAGARAVRLGPEVLRASTAAAVALGALGALTRRWEAHQGEASSASGRWPGTRDSDQSISSSLH